MATDLTRRKLREAGFFLGEMRNREGTSRLDTHEEFGYCLSAFLSAARSVSFVLRKENPLTYEAQRDAWQGSLKPGAKAVADFMLEQRNAAIKEGTDAAEQEIEDVPALWVCARESGIFTPWAYDGATIGVARYVLDLAGVQRPAVEACREYLEALELLVARFEA